MIETLFMDEEHARDPVPTAADRIKRTVQIVPRTLVIADGGLQLKLNIIDTPGFSDAVDNTDWFAATLRRHAKRIHAKRALSLTPT